MRKVMSVVLAMSIFLGIFAASVSVNAATENKVSEGNVIYSEDFDAVADGQLPEGYKLGPTLSGKGTAYVQDGSLFIDATNAEFGKLLIPDTLDTYRNYVIEADVSFVSSKDTSRWLSIVFRQQAQDEKYYHMCVRRNTKASNGVEFAERTPGSWNVMSKGSASVSIDTTMTHLKVAVFDGKIIEYVDGKQVITMNGLDATQGYNEVGGIGLMANYSVAKFDNIKVTECTGIELGKTNEDFAAFTSAKDTIISRAATITEPKTIDEFNDIVSGSPKATNVMFTVDDNGNIEGLGLTLDELLPKVKAVVVPVFVVNTEAAADVLGSFLKTNKVLDAMVCSSKPELVTKIRKAYKKAGGVIDFRGSDKTLDEMIFTTNENWAKTAIIPEKLATKDNVEYMQRRIITVWVAETTDNDILLHDSIQSGANGIITDTPDALANAYFFYQNDYNVLVRNPSVIGHRGLPSKAPENTIDSAVAAQKAGVDVIELDVRLTKDGEVVIYHNDNLQDITTGSGTCNQNTLANIKKATVLKSVSYGPFNDYKKSKIATLKEFFEEFKNDDVIFFVEIKENSKDICPKTAEIIKQYKMENRVCVITFFDAMITAFRKEIPGISCGYLMNGISGASTEDIVQSAIQTLGTYNATYNAAGVSNKNVIKSLVYRGITTWPWTYNAGNTLSAYFNGVGGVTTDTGDLCGEIPVKIDIGDKMDYTLGKDGTIEFDPVVRTRIGTYEDVQPQLLVMGGEDCIEVDGNTVKAKQNGTAYLMYKLQGDINWTGFTLYTQIIKVNVDMEYVQPETKDKGCGGMISGAMLASLCGVAFVLMKKKEN